MSSMATRNKVLAAGASLLAASLAFVFSYEFLDWLLIRFWGSQHGGRRMVFSFWADFRALPSAVLISVVVLFLTYRFVRCRAHGAQ
jgi:hypothetical protein